MNNMIVKSPITDSTNTKHIVTYETSIMSDSHITPQRVDNYLCLDTGLIFNASGPRGSEKGFYTDEYDLHSENDDSEFKYFESSQAVGIYDDIATFISQHLSIDTSPTILDIGCGKGILLDKLGRLYPGSILCGVEPSRNATRFFQKALSHTRFYEGTFEDSPFLHEKFDLITANGVLEHVPNPVEFLKRIRSSISESGMVYIGVPNFANNPADLFTYDHLSRFTPDTVNLVFQLAGFEIIASKISNQRVPMWFLLKPVTPKSLNQLDSDINSSSELIKKTLYEIAAFFKSYEIAVHEAKIKQKKIALYGTGALGLIATCYTKLETNLIQCIFDDNSSIWGSDRLGIKVIDPRQLSEMNNISEIVISANPCYVDLIENRIKSLIKGSSITLHTPKIC